MFSWLLFEYLQTNGHKGYNSQVNEQANAGLQWIRGQLAYMTPENFMFTLKLLRIRMYKGN